MAITIPLATFSWLCVERPAIRWAQRVTTADRGRRPRRRPRSRAARAPRRQRTGERPALRPQPAER